MPPWVSAYIGIPYDARLAHCWSLVRRVYAEQFTIALPSYDDGPAGTDTVAVRLVMQAERDRLEGEAWERTEAPGVGDVLLFRRGMLPAHVGIFVAPARMLHALAGQDSTIEDFTSSTWRPRLLGAFRHREREV